MKHKILNFLLTLLVVGCTSSDEVDQDILNELLTPFVRTMTLNANDEVYQIDVDNTANTLSYEGELPKHTVITAVNIDFDLNLSTAQLRVGDEVLTPGVSTIDLSQDVELDLFYDNEVKSTYTLSVAQSDIASVGFASAKFGLVTITNSHPLKINNADHTIVAVNPYPKEESVDKVTLVYELYSEEDKLMYNDNEVVSGVTEIDCSSDVTLTISSDSRDIESVEYTLAVDQSAARILVNEDDYQQEYVGGGTSYALYGGHIWSMSSEGQNQFFDMMFKDVQMQYLQVYASDYPISQDKVEYSTSKFDGLINMAVEARRRDPDIELSFVTGTYPEDCYEPEEFANGNEVLDIHNKYGRTGDRANVYVAVAEWMHECVVYMKNKGYEFAVINVSNEPDWGKSYKWGYSDNKKGLGIAVQEIIPKFKELCRASGHKVPLIMGPGTISATGCYSYISEWQKNYPDAWAQIDIVTTHQYGSFDHETGFKNAAALIKAENEGTNTNIEGNKRRFIQNEQHTNKGDRISNAHGTLEGLESYSADGNEDREAVYRVLSMGNMFTMAVNNMVDSWFYFVTNVPSSANAGLLITKWGATETLTQPHYNAFKQMNSIQSDMSHVITYDETSATKDYFDIVCFRHKDENRAVVHVVHYKPDPSPFDIQLKGGQTIKSVKVYQSAGGGVSRSSSRAVEIDLTQNKEVELIDEFEYNGTVLSQYIAPYTLTTYDITFEENE